MQARLTTFDVGSPPTSAECDVEVIVERDDFGRLAIGIFDATRGAVVGVSAAQAEHLIYWLMCELQNCLARRVPTASMTGIILQ